MLVLMLVLVLVLVLVLARPCSSSSFVSTQGPEREVAAKNTEHMSCRSFSDPRRPDDCWSCCKRRGRQNLEDGIVAGVPRRRAQKVHASRDGARTFPKQVPFPVDLSFHKQLKHPSVRTAPRYLPRARLPGRRCVVPIILIRTPLEARRCDRPSLQAVKP
ncbi:hypothetical protein F5882DRAFT_63551 [Hyaloscypha sp. PMI_1271]|nr:hypothetical protein F5882DRAFT_63551 [Hyaloscypha sp. PMI_1271]